MTSKLADDYSEINRRLEEIAAERQASIMGKPLEDAKPIEAPADIDWTGMYGYVGINRDPMPFWSNVSSFKDFIG